jgi:hypothetical protein
MNALSHPPHTKDFPPLWVRSCLRKSLSLVNALTHPPQTKGFAAFMFAPITALPVFLLVPAADERLCSAVGAFMSAQLRALAE